MLERAGVTFNMVDPPEDRVCKSGHSVSDGGVRFFRVSGPNLPLHRVGVYCEDCIRLATKLGQAKRQQMKRQGLVK